MVDNWSLWLLFSSCTKLPLRKGQVLWLCAQLKKWVISPTTRRKTVLYGQFKAFRG